jgi:hypothetical protein
MRRPRIRREVRLFEVSKRNALLEDFDGSEEVIGREEGRRGGC